MAGVPVELSVATILDAIIALLPTPDTTTLPWDSRMCCTAWANCSSSRLTKFCMALLSVSMVLFAMDKIDWMSLNVINRLSNCIPKRICYI